MENLSHSRHPNRAPRKTCNGNGNASFGGAKSMYDDIFGGPPKCGGVPTLSPRAEDYIEIFGNFNASRASSIPVLDLPEVDDAELYFDVRSSGFDYSDVFGGSDGSDFAASYEDLFGKSMGVDAADFSSDEAWTPAETESLSEESYHSGNDPCFSIEDPYQSFEGSKEFSISYHKAGQSTKEDLPNGLRHAAQVQAVPGYSFLVDQTAALPKTVGKSASFPVADGSNHNAECNGVKLFRKVMSHPPHSNDGRETFGSDFGPQRGYDNDCIRSNGFVTISEISLQTEPSHLPPPSRPPPLFGVKNGESSRSTSNCKSTNSDGTAGDSSPTFFDVEVDASISAAASAAAMKEAMRKAQAKMKSAKEMMERKKEGLQGHTKPDSKSRVNNSKEDHLAKRSAEEKNGRGSFSSLGSDKIDGADEWKEATQFFELVRTDKQKKAVEQTNVDQFLEQHAKVLLRGLNDGAAMEAYEQEEINKKTKSVWHEFELEEEKLKVAQEAFDLEENNGRPKLAEDKRRLKEHDRMALQQDEIAKRLKEAARRDEKKKLKEARERAVNEKILIEALQQVENKKMLEDTLEQEERERKLRKTREREERERRQRKAREREEDEQRLKEAREREENEKPKEACEREVIERREREARELEDNVKRLKEARKREENEKKKLKESREREEIERRQREAREIEENMKRLKEALEREEYEKKLKEASEREETERRQREAREREHEKKVKEAQEKEHEKRLKEAREREEHEKRLKEAREREEHEKIAKEAREREDHEKRLKEAREREEQEKRLKEAREREEQEKRLKEAREREEQEKRLKEAREREEQEKRLKEAREREEHEKRAKEAREREEQEKRAKEAQERKEQEKILKEARKREEHEKRLKEAREREEHEKRAKEALERGEHEKRFKEALERGEHEKRFKEAREKQENEKRLKEAHERRQYYGNTQKEVHEREDVEKRLRDACEREENEKTWREALVQEESVKSQNEAEGRDETEKRFREGRGREEVEKRVADFLEQENDSNILKNDLRRKEPEDSERKSVVVETENVVVNERNRASGIARTNSEQPRKENAVESRHLDDNIKKEGEVGTGIGQPCVNRSENIHKFTSTEMGKEWAENGGQLETDRPAVLERRGSLHKIDKQVNRMQGTVRKDKDLNETCISEEIESERIKRERELEQERLRKIEEEIERERERKKDRMAVDRATLEARETAREKVERAAVDRVAAEARQRVLAEARERLEKACAEAREKSLPDKAAIEARLRAERAAVERATAEARERAAFGAKERVERSFSDKFSGYARNGGIRQTYSSSDLQDLHVQSVGSSAGSRNLNSSGSGASNFAERYEGDEGESAQRCRARLERHRRTAERAAKALAEKNMRDLLAQREQAERNRLSEILDAEVKRWSSGKEGNLRALLSTLQYILGSDSGWTPIPLTEVITNAAVKKAYRKATLCVHPDKLQQRGANIQQKYICEKVFDLLKEAWNKFNSEER